MESWTELELGCLHIHRTSLCSGGYGTSTNEHQPALLHEGLARYIQGFEPRGYFKGYLELTDKGRTVLKAARARPVVLKRENEEPNEPPESDDRIDQAWRREIAIEAGMLHGVDAYNDAMGY